MNSENAMNQNFEKDYDAIMENARTPSLPFVPVDPQWNGPNDFIKKFSLYQESPGTITSTDTLAIY